MPPAPLISALSTIIIVVNNAARCYWFNHGLSMRRRSWKLCVPCWSLNVTDCPHKRKATLDQYVTSDDRPGPEQRSTPCSAIHYTFMHMRYSPFCKTCLPFMCVCLFFVFFYFVCVRHIQGRGSMGGSVQASEKCQWSPQRDKRHEQEIRSRKWIKDTQDKRGTERKKKLQNNTKTWQNDFKRPRSDVGCLCQTIQQGWEDFYMLRVICSDK